MLKLFIKKRTFVEVLKEYFQHKSLDVRASTVDKHWFFYQNIVTFFEQRDLLKLPIDKVKISHMEEMRLWMHKEKKRTNDHVSRHIDHCKAAMDYAVLREYTRHNPLSPIKRKKDEMKSVVSLTADELQKFKNHVPKSMTYELVIDLFLFQCYTGLSYVDLWHYEILKLDGMRFITGKRFKTNKDYWAEYGKEAEAIHNKYRGKFPTISNQAYNRMLKRLALMLNINKSISTHTGRKTAATLKYIQGHSVESIADQLGNTPDMTRKHYLSKGWDRVKSEILRLQDRAVFKFN